jgi:beta-lactamase superfamily II metal-dependent hydrolase
MPSLTRVMILYCGQGMMTLVEIYSDGKEKPAADYLALIDAGGSTSKGASPSVDYVATKILAKADKKLDLMSISHQDGDHVRLLSDLTEKLEGKGATCGRLFAGGSGWSSANKGTVKEFAKVVGIVPETIVFGAPNCSDYGGAKKRDELKHLAQFGDVFFRILISGLPVTGTTGDIQKNASSATVVIENGSFSVVLPGDATYQTMAAATAILQQVTPSLLPQVIGLQIPHHGALRTAVEDYVARGNIGDFNWTKLEEFARVLNAKHVLASAGPRNTHHHPIEEVFWVFRPGLIAIPSHDYTSYLFANFYGQIPPGWVTWTTDAATSSTVRRLSFNDGSWVAGDLEVSITGPGLLATEDMVRFIPRAMIPGGAGPDDIEDLIVFAPAPYESAPAT